MSPIPEFGLSASVEDGQAVVRVRGELDIATASDLKECLIGLLDGGTSVITVDVSDLEFIDSNGIHAIVMSVKRAQQSEQEIRLKSPRPSTLKVLEMVGLTEVIPIV